MRKKAEILWIAGPRLLKTISLAIALTTSSPVFAEKTGMIMIYRSGLTTCADETQYRAAMRMAMTKPTTPASAGALVAYAQHNVKDGLGPDWPLIALRIAATTLTLMNQKAA